ncbi:unnamed protein product [Adineta steineri]|uniref:ADP ribosyltransferase domain-containing protein n=1 Tax=Adineta steineri TaxID=433720 RepID=A0A814BD32_9BILA|nr:unnamed protein product [Adineta steineri]CAF1507998.1 unnamed protein product [Adineta steineri]
MEYDLIPISIIPMSPQLNIDTLDQSFMYSQLVKEIILDIEYNTNAKKELVDFCRLHYAGNTRELEIINEFEKHYDDPSPIWWYTRECFTYMMLNKALRTQDLEVIVKMAFFIRDLHQQIKELQWQSNCQNQLFVYRGQGMLNDEFDKLTKNQGGLFSFNNFLSTSTKREVSIGFARRARINAALTGILFEMKIDPTISSIPFASLDQISYFSTEKEILFSMNTVFRIGQMKQLEDRLWQVDLTLTSGKDQQLQDLTDYLRNEIGGGNGWQRMGILMFKMGEFSKATEIYKTLVADVSDTTDAASADLQAATYNNTALTYQTMGQHTLALSFFEKALEIKLKYYPPNDSSLAVTYNNVGMVHNSLGNFAAAQSYFEKTIDIWQKSLPSNHSSFGAVYNNLCGMHQSMGNYSTALLYAEKALTIWKESLPADHPNLATAYSNIGNLHQSMNNYSAALLTLNKCLEIRLKILPPNHPDIANTYRDLGALCQYLSKYQDALSYFEKALEIQEKSRSLNHADLATTYNNIGTTYISMNDNSTALSYLQKALEIQQKYLSCDHIDLGRTYINIGQIQHSSGQLSIALSYYEKALDIWQKRLPSNHPSMATIYNDMTMACAGLGRKREAVAYAERCVAISVDRLGPDHLQTKAIRLFVDHLRRQM